MGINILVINRGEKMTKNNKAVRTLLNNYPNYKGSKVIDLLYAYPDTPLSASDMELAVNLQIPPEFVFRNRYHFAPILMTDAKTLRNIDKRLNHLIELKAFNATDEYDEEIQALIRYRQETTLPTGKIKCFNDDDSSAYNRLRKNIDTLLKQAEKDGYSEAVAIVKRCLRRGLMMCWNSKNG